MVWPSSFKNRLQWSLRAGPGLRGASGAKLVGALRETLLGVSIDIKSYLNGSTRMAFKSSMDLWARYQVAFVLVAVTVDDIGDLDYTSYYTSYQCWYKIATKSFFKRL